MPIFPSPGQSVATYTDIINFATTGPVLIAPAIPGNIFVPTKLGYLVTSKAGTATVAVTASMGDNASNYDNVVASTAGFPATAAMIQYQMVNNSGLATTQTRTPGAAMYVNITVGAAGTGGFSLFGRYWALGFYIPVL